MTRPTIPEPIDVQRGGPGPVSALIHALDEAINLRTLSSPRGASAPSWWRVSAAPGTGFVSTLTSTTYTALSHNYYLAFALHAGRLAWERPGAAL